MVLTLRSRGITDLSATPSWATFVALIGGYGPVVAALVLRGSEAAGSGLVLGGGAILLGPLIAWSGYTFLRDQELEPYSGNALGVRCLACGAGFAAGWLAYYVLAAQIGGSWTIGEFTPLVLVFLCGVAVGIGTFATSVDS